MVIANSMVVRQPLPRVRTRGRARVGSKTTEPIYVRRERHHTAASAYNVYLDHFEKVEAAKRGVCYHCGVGLANRLAIVGEERCVLCGRWWW